MMPKAFCGQDKEVDRKMTIEILANLATLDSDTQIKTALVK